MAAVSKIDREELERQVSQCSGFVKMMCGVANNCAILIVNMCRSKIEDIRDEDSYKERPKRPHPGYKHRAKLLFRQFFQEWHMMESALLYPLQARRASSMWLTCRRMLVRSTAR